MDRAHHVIAPEKYVLKETGHPAEQAIAELWSGSCRVFGVTRGRAAGSSRPGTTARACSAGRPAPVAAVDSNGAGDTFHGAYAWAVARGPPPAECFEVAAWAAALKLTRPGNAGIPTLDELERARAASDRGRDLQRRRLRRLVLSCGLVTRRA